MPITAGSTPAVAKLAIRASGLRPRRSASLALITTSAAAPSLMPLALPAVTVPSLEKAGRSLAMVSGEASWRMYSSSDDDRVALAALDRDRRDLVLELAGLLRRARLLLAGGRELVLLLAGDLELGRATFSAVVPMW